MLSREQLLQLLAGRDAEAYDRSIDMQVVRLRRKIEPDRKHPSLIVTIPNSGYKFAAKVRQAEAAALRGTGRDPPETTPAAAERRYVTALAAEVLAADGTSLPGDPEELRVLIDAYRRYAAAVIARHGGVMAESRVRETLAYFGYPVAQEHAAERALHAALALAEHLPEGEMALPAGLAIRIGVASGLVVADPSGELLGETPGEAVRLQHLAEPGQVIIAASTRRLAGDLFAYRDLGAACRKGCRRSGAGVAGAWSEHARQPLRGALCRGGDAAGWPRGRVEYAAAGLAAGKVRRGPPRAAVRRAGDRQVAPARGAGRGIGRRTACESAVLLLTAASGQRAASDRGALGAGGRFRAWGFAPSCVCASWRPIVAPADLPPEDVALIAAMLSVPTDDRYLQLELNPQRRKERTFGALLRRLDRMTRSHPVLMLFEDAQWADPSSLELLDTLIDRLAQLPILLVISFRAEFTAPWVGRAGASLIALSRLNRWHSADTGGAGDRRTRAQA